MAIRAVTDLRGNTITETLHELLKREVDDSTVAAEPSTQLSHLKEQNSELKRTNGLLKAAAALLAAALDSS
ncbi:hypothetical protein [Mycobacterium decipiens]|uniref:hypothetical protein n=1 Tax=Mycobacterium decipiens TaxID=1430326 RepID=UPI0013FD44A5|nr:hypothetical protein [Mycobacterium decipiens]